MEPSVESDLGNVAISLQAASTQNNGSFNGLDIPDSATVGKYDIEDAAGRGRRARFTVSQGNTIEIDIAADGSYTLTGTNDNLTGTGDFEIYSERRGWPSRLGALPPAKSDSDYD